MTTKSHFERACGYYELMAPRSDRCPMCKRKLRRSSQANRMYWELLHLMASREWRGVRYSADQFHLYYKSRFLGADDVRLPNGSTLTIPRSTADLPADEFSLYLDQVQADANERGVFLADMERAA